MHLPTFVIRLLDIIVVMQLAKLAESLGLPEEAETLEDDIEACQTAGISAHMK